MRMKKLQPEAVAFLSSYKHPQPAEHYMPQAPQHAFVSLPRVHHTSLGFHESLWLGQKPHLISNTNGLQLFISPLCQRPRYHLVLMSKGWYATNSTMLLMWYFHNSPTTEYSFL